MNTKERKELAKILGDIARDLSEIKVSVVILSSKAETAEGEFNKINRSMTNLTSVCAETQRTMEQIRTNVMSTVDKQGKEIRRLKLVKNGDDGGGRRPARKNS